MENINYSNNTNNVTVLGASAHETSEVKIYEHPLFGKVRMFVQDGKTWFCGTDIATSLGYSNPRKAILDHCKSHGVTNRDAIDSLGRTQQMKFINEGNIYRLTAKSQMPKADEFESWIFDEIVPSVVNTGSYSVQPQVPQSFAEALMLAAQQQIKIEEQQKLIEQKEQEKKAIEAETKPAVVFTECVKNAPTNILVRDLAKLITQNLSPKTDIPLENTGCMIGLWRTDILFVTSDGVSQRTNICLIILLHRELLKCIYFL